MTTPEERDRIIRAFTGWVREALGPAILPGVERKLVLIEALRIGEAFDAIEEASESVKQATGQE